MRVNLTTKLAVLIVVVTVLSTLLLGVLAFISFRSTLQTEIVNRLSFDATRTMSRWDAFMLERQTDIELLASQNNYAHEIEDYSVTEKTAYLRDFAQQKKVYSFISVYDANGTKVIDTQGFGLGINSRDEPFISEALKGNVYHDPRPTVDETVGVHVIHFSAPIYDDNGSISAIIVTAFLINKINDILEEASSFNLQTGTEADEISLVDSDGLILFSNMARGSALERNISDSKIFRAFKQSGLNVMAVAGDDDISTEIEEEEHGDLFVLVREQGYLDYPGDGWIIIKSVDIDIAFAPINRFLHTFIITATVLIVIVIGISIMLARRITRPIIYLKDSAEKIAEGRYDVHIETRGNDEITDLTSTFLNMALQVKKAQESFANYSRNLENAVGERTDDLRKSLEKQKQLEKIKTEFLSITSHELRTPITPMKAQLQMVLQGYFGNVSDQQKKSLGMVLQNAERLDRLIGDILDISKLESGNMRFTFVEADLRQVVEFAFETMKTKANERNINLVLHVTDVPKLVFDKDRVAQVIINFINNAIKFTDAHGQITVELAKDGEQVFVKVRDTGIGISPEDAKRLFHPFVQVDSSLNRNYEGSGLGLAICRGIIENHGGKIWVESEKGKGSTFIFTIPFKHVERKPVELFSFNKDQALRLFMEEIGKHGYDIVPEKKEQIVKDMVSDDGKLRPHQSFTDLENQGLIRKK